MTFKVGDKVGLFSHPHSTLRRMMRLASIKEVVACLRAGAQLIFSHRECRSWLRLSDDRVHYVDGRAYKTFILRYQKQYRRTETGSCDDGSLVITWEEKPCQE